MELTHLQIQELLGVYALDAVSAEEADLVEVHLRDCPRCRAEVADHREVAASLAHVGSTAPEGVWSRIAGSLEEAPPKLDMARVVALRPPRRSVPLRLVASVAAVAAAVIAVLGVQVSRLDSRTGELASALQRNGLDQAARAALFDDGARRVSLVSDDGATFVQAVVRRNGEAYLVGNNLPPLPEGETYQLWALLGDDRAVSVGVLGASPGVSAFKVAGDDVTVLALTTEQAGGVAAPTKAPVVKGTVPA